MSQRMIALVLACGLGLPAMAETGQFRVTVGPLTAGTLAYAGEDSGGRYAATGAVRASGLAGLFLDTRVDAAASGRVTGNAYRPERFDQTTVEDGAEVSSAFRYRDGVPTVTRTPPPRKPPKFAADPGKQGGTVDPMTAAYAILRDRPADLACDLAIQMFDGRRRADIRLVGGEAVPGGLSCRGEYRRVEGFSPEELAEKPVWPFTVSYRAAGGVLQVEEVRVPTTFGAVRIRRQ